jgi:sugar phosphate isomerase/epimerase
MQFGICAPLSDADAARSAGGDFLEISVQSLPVELAGTNLPVRACNALVPATLKITGMEANSGGLRDYLARTCQAAAAIGVEILVFGSGAARHVPDGFDSAKVRPQLLDFLRAAGWAASEHGLTVVIEPLSRAECNVLHTIDECMELVKLVNLPSVQCLVDSYHFWVNGDSLESLRRAMPHIYHVHVADREGRVAPGLSGSSDYLPLFRVLKEGGYNRRISIEALNFNIAADGKRAMDYLRQQWKKAGGSAE